MRTEKEMMDLILNTAKEDDRIRAVYMNGSRTNLNAPKDIFQDYDVVYVVKETASFTKDREWINRFGDILFMQYPDDFPNCPKEREKSYAWLMVFTDGNRIDLTVKEISHAKENILEDSLCTILMDKDGILPDIPESSDIDYRIKKPTKEEFAATCNEFWWCLNNIAKGLWRKEVTYAQDMLNFVVRKQLEKVLAWKIGVLTDYSVSIGKSGKYMYKWLSKEDWNTYLKTFCSAEVDSMWSAVEIMCNQFYDISKWVAEQNGYKFAEVEAKNSFQFFKTVKELEADADSITLIPHESSNTH